RPPSAPSRSKSQWGSGRSEVTVGGPCECKRPPVGRDELRRSTGAREATDFGDGNAGRKGPGAESIDFAGRDGSENLIIVPARERAFDQRRLGGDKSAGGIGERNRSDLDLRGYA